MLSRAADDEKFWDKLMELGSKGLDQYRLISDAKAAIASGDLKWINEHVGELNQKQVAFIFKRLERESYWHIKLYIDIIVLLAYKIIYSKHYACQYILEDLHGKSVSLRPGRFR